MKKVNNKTGNKKIILLIIFLMLIVGTYLILLIFRSVVSEYSVKELKTSNTLSQVHVVGCELMRNSKGKVDCFGCSRSQGNMICKDPLPDFFPYTPNSIGIPYSCAEGLQGCELVQ